MNDIVGTENNDILEGTVEDDLIQGLGGNDTLNGGPGNDQLEGGDGNDTLRGGTGNDTLLGGDGNDFLDGDEGVDNFDGGAGDDRIILEFDSAGENVTGGTGNDTIERLGYGGSADIVDAGDGDDLVTAVLQQAGGNNPVVTLGAGQDTIRPQSTTSTSTTINHLIVTDFAPGSGGDLVDLSIVLSTLSSGGWDGTSNPFDAGQGFLQLTQDGADTVLQIDPNGGGDNFRDLIRFQNTTAAAFKSGNFSPAFDINPGVNDAPVITPGGDVSGAVVEDTVLSASGDLDATDVDNGAVLAWTLQGAAPGGAEEVITNVDYTFAIDQLNVVKNGATLFTDDFDDGTPPPSADLFSNGNEAVYGTSGLFTEVGGRAIMDGSVAGPTESALFSSIPFLGHSARLRTNISNDPADLNRGLKIDDDFAIEGRFDLAIPDENGEAYGIRLSDRVADGPNAQPGDDVMELVVRRGGDGTVRVQFRERDFDAGEVNNIQSMVLNPAGADQIVLRLGHEAASPGVVTASFDLLSGGTVIDTVTFANTGQIFGTETPGDITDDELWTRAQIVAFSPGEVESSSLEGQYGTMSISQNGEWSYLLDNDSPLVQALAAGEVVTDTFTAIVADEFGATDSQEINVTVTGINDAPVLDLNGAGAGVDVTLDYAENDPATAIAPLVSLTDPDSGDFNGGLLNIGFTANGSANDQLTVENQGTGPGEIGVAGNIVTYGGAEIGTFAGGADGGNLVVSFDSSAATVEAVETLIAHILYSNTSETPSDLPRTVLFTVVDGDGNANGGNDVANATATINVTPAANGDPIGVPVIDDTTPTEGGVLTALVDGIEDPDGTTTSVFAFQWQQADATGVGGGASGFSDIPGANSATFTPTQDQVDRELRVVVTFTDDGGTVQTVFSAPTLVTGDLFEGANGGDIVIGTEGEDHLFGNGGSDTLLGNGGDDILDGGAGADTIRGNDGDDLIIGGAGGDLLLGGAGDDTFDYTFGDGVDTIFGDEDFDTLRVFGTSDNNVLNVLFDGSVLTTLENGELLDIESVTADLLEGVDTLTYGTTAASVVVDLNSGTASGFDAVEGIENVTGGVGDDMLFGDAADNVLIGGGGNDLLVGGLGLDVLNGGGGIDTVSYAGELDDMYVDLLAGEVRRGSDMAAVEDTLSAIENVIGGGGSDVIAGNNAANTIEGGLGDDTLSGNGGADTILGGEGNDVIEGGKSNDTLLGEAGDDMFIFTIGDGTDSVDGGIDLDTLSIFGTASNNTLDVIFDGVGITAFEGGALTGVEAVIADLLDGADRLNYDGTTADIEVDLSTGAASGFASIANIENVTGGSGNDIFTGDALVNNFAGRAGDDTYFVEFGDTINEAADGGIDTVFTDSGSFNLSGNVENLTYTGASNFVGAGNGSDNVITGGSDTDVLDGKGGADTLIGGAGADVLSGGAGDDLLFGGTGDDLMNGNAGNDMFVFDSLGFGDDIIQGFDANPTNGQDLLDFTLLGITADDFADRVDVVDIGSATQVTVDGGTAMGGGSILLLGVNGNGANAIDIDDFILMA